MSDFDDSVIEPFIELVTSQGDAPVDKEQHHKPGSSETTASLSQTPVDDAQSFPGHYPLPHRLPRQEKGEEDDDDKESGSDDPVLPAFHVHESPAEGGSGSGSGVCDSSYSPPLPLMTLHLPFRSDAAASASAIVAADDNDNDNDDDDDDEFLSAATGAALPAMDEHSYHTQPQHHYLWNHTISSDSKNNSNHHHHHDTVDCFVYGDASTCGSGASISPASPAASFVSAATSLNNHHHDASSAVLDPWHGLSPASPLDLPSPDAEDALASPSTPGAGYCGGHTHNHNPQDVGDDVVAAAAAAVPPFDTAEWHCEHVSPLRDLVGFPISIPISTGSPRPAPSSPVQRLTSSSSSSTMPSSSPFMPPPPPPPPMSGVGFVVAPEQQHHLQYHHLLHASYGGTGDVGSHYHPSLPPSEYHHHHHPNQPRTGAELAAQIAAQSPNQTTSTDATPYAQLIFKALMSREDHSMCLQDIYQWFRENTDKTKGTGKGWQNSIRHNLSMNRGFVKRERKGVNMTGSTAHLVDDMSGESKRSTEWTLQDWAIVNGIQSTTRYRGSKAGSSGTGNGNGAGTGRKGNDNDGHRRSSPGSPYPGYRTRARPYGSRVASLNGQGHGQGHGHGSQHSRSASVGSMRPPTSHYYPSSSSTNVTGGGPNLADPYREQLMHEAAAIMATQSPYGPGALKRESSSSSAISAVNTGPPPSNNDDYRGAGGVGIMIPSYHGLLQTLDTVQGHDAGDGEPDFLFGTQHVHVGFPHTVTRGQDDGHGIDASDYTVDHGHHHAY